MVWQSVVKSFSTVLMISSFDVLAAAIFTADLSEFITSHHVKCFGKRGFPTPSAGQGLAVLASTQDHNYYKVTSSGKEC